MIHHKIDQNTDEWLLLRQGKFTASSFSDLFATKTTAQYKKAIRKVVFERLTGESPESFKNEYMERGHELEVQATEAYELYSFNEVTDGGFFELDEWTGASPDGLVNQDGQIEIKSPAYNTFIDYILSEKVPTEYTYQIQGQLYITGRKWCDFIAFHPKLPMIVIRVYPDPVIIEQIKTALDVAIAEAKIMIEKITNLKNNE
jgi:putative phage-type endonuclease